MTDFGGKNRRCLTDEHEAGIHHGNRRAITQVNSKRLERLIVKTMIDVSDSHIPLIAFLALAVAQRSVPESAPSSLRINRSIGFGTVGWAYSRVLGPPSCSNR